MFQLDFEKVKRRAGFGEAVENHPLGDAAPKSYFLNTYGNKSTYI
jgi:hypothetical protein